MTSALDGAFFRHAYGRLVAMLVRRYGVARLEAVEDAVQSALLAAVETWPIAGEPDNPTAWLHRTAHNALLDGLRRDAGRMRIASTLPDAGDVAEPPSTFLAGDVEHDLLRMLFVCCHPAVPIEGQLVFALKTLCGFGVTEIGQRLFLTDANVYKRLSRARERLRDHAVGDDELSLAELSARMPAVESVLYLMFTEGHLSSHEDGALRRDLCDEALRLASSLAKHAVGGTPEMSALVALMHLHRARSAARIDAVGGLVLLEEQDRAAWDAADIAAGIAWLERSASGDVVSRYHLEAAIAAEHCLAPSFAATHWERVVELYEQLDRLACSPLHTLNRALAIAECRGPRVGLDVLAGLAPPTWLDGSFLWTAVLADLHGRAGDDDVAARYRELTLEGAPSAQVRAALARRLATRRFAQ